MIELIVHTLLLLGASFLLLAAIGILRLPDVYMRLSAISKAGSMGLGCMLLALIFHFQETAVTSRALLVILFYFLTSPVSAQMISRAAYSVGVPFWKETFINEMAAPQPKGPGESPPSE